MASEKRAEGILIADRNAEGGGGCNLGHEAESTALRTYAAGQFLWT